MVMLSVGQPAWSGVQYFGASMAQSHWRVEAAPQACRLIHDIPRYGRAVFSQVPGETLAFALHVYEPPAQPGYATVRSIPPHWKHDAGVRPLGRVAINPGMTPIRWERELTLRLYYELESGRVAQFLYQDWADGLDEVQVSLSPIRFRDAFVDFANCMTAMAMRGSSFASSIASGESSSATPVPWLIYFATDSDELTHHAREILRGLAGALVGKLGDNVLLISGHADRRGTNAYNDRLSMRRTQAVRRFLSTLGIPGEKIQAHHFGEQRPVDTRDTEQAWARNRRVSLALTPSRPTPTIRPFVQVTQTSQ